MFKSKKTIFIVAGGHFIAIGALVPVPARTTP
jgi:hypothetical protein